MDAAEWMDGGMAYRIAVANFTQLVPGTAFCHQNVVKASGAIDTTTIALLGEATQRHSMTMMSSPLVWHRYQNSTYLNARLSPNVIRPDGDDGGYCLQMTNTASSSAMTDAQVAYTFARTPQVEPGIKYKLTMMVRGTAEGTVQCATYSNGRGSRFTPNIAVTKEWKRVELTNTMATGIKGLTSVLFSMGQYVGTLYVDDIELYEVDNKGNEVTDNLNTQNTHLDDAETTAGCTAIHADTHQTLEGVGVSALGDGYDPLATYVEKTDAEKQAILTEEMTRYLGSVMDVSSANTTDWLVVCEPLDDGTAEGAFYWQDYLGREGYAVTAFREAAKHTSGKLYIGESGLAADAEKCRGLIAFIQQIESQGARVDGIAVNIVTDRADENDYAQMFQLLAGTGKLVKIGNLQVTAENQPRQAAVYTAILDAYASQVPTAQRGGIVQHQVLDSDQPWGLWTQDYSRKHAFGVVAEKLRNENYDYQER